MIGTPATASKQLSPSPEARTTGGAVRTLAAAATVLIMAGCAPLLTGTSDPGKIQTIMDSTKARGCIYSRASAKPWVSATVVLVGTFGEPPPTMAECWKHLPPELP